jgi:hypothetical protein
MTELSGLLQLINAGGVLALLAFFTWAFYNGEIISKKMLDKIIQTYSEQTEKSLHESVNRIVEEIRKKGW